MKVKLKVKHLIIVPILIFIIIPNILYFIGRGMFSTRWGFENGVTSREYSYGVFNLYTKWPKVLSPFEGDAYFYMGRLKYDYNVKFISNGGNNIIGGKTSLGTYEEAVNLHKKGLEKSVGVEYSFNAVALFNLYMEKGEVDKAKEIINGSLNKKSYKENSAGKVLEIQMALMEGDKKKAKELYEESYTIVRNNSIERFLGIEEDEYYNIDKREIGDKIRVYNEKSLLNELGEGMNIPRVYKLREYKENGESELIKGNVTVKGRLTIEGKPLKYTPVIIGNVICSEYASNLNFGGLEGEVVFTDENGNYEIKNMPELEYTNVAPVLGMEIGEKYTTPEEWIKYTENGKTYTLDLNYEKRLDIKIDKDLKLEGNKFEINFDKVEGADYYNTTMMFIEDGLGMSETIQTKENKVLVPLIDGSFGPFAAHITREYLMDIRDEEDIIGGGEPIMGMGEVQEISYGGRYKKDEIDYVEVKAIKVVDGEERVINSNKIKTNIEGKEVKENEGINLLNEGKLEEGEAWILNKIKEEGYKPEYIYTLVRLYTHHYTFDYSQNLKGFFTEERLEKAKKSEEVLLKELYKINENKDEISYLKGEYESFYQMYRSEE